MSSIRILLFVHTLEHPNSPLFVTWKKIPKETISMTLILFENEVNHENLEIAIKKMAKNGIFQKFVFSNGSLRTSSTRILFFVRALEHPNSPRFPI